jgi:hypothetical protein
MEELQEREGSSRDTRAWPWVRPPLLQPFYSRPTKIDRPSPRTLMANEWAYHLISVDNTHTDEPSRTAPRRLVIADARDPIRSSGQKCLEMSYWVLSLWSPFSMATRSKLFDMSRYRSVTP